MTGDPAVWAALFASVLAVVVLVWALAGIVLDTMRERLVDDLRDGGPNGRRDQPVLGRADRPDLGGPER